MIPSQNSKIVYVHEIYQKIGSKLDAKFWLYISGITHMIAKAVPNFAHKKLLTVYIAQYVLRAWCCL